MAETHHHIIGAAAIIRRGDEILIARKDPNIIGPAQGAWVLPAGIVDPGENPFDTVEREVLEETNLKVKVNKVIDFSSIYNLWKTPELRKKDWYPDIDYWSTLVYFDCEYISGEPKAGDDIVEVKWIKAKDIDKHINWQSAHEYSKVRKFISEIGKPLNIAVSGAAGQVAYAFLARLVSENLFGNPLINLKLLEIEPAMKATEAVKMELEDCASPFIKDISITSNPDEAFKDADWAILIGSAPLKGGIKRADLLPVNGKIFQTQGKSLAKNAKPTCKVLVVGNPCNTNAYIAKESAKGKIPEENFFALTMLDHNRAKSKLAQKTNTHASNVRKMAIWGNHSDTQFPNFFHTKINDKPVTEQIDLDWLQNEFVDQIRQRGAKVNKARGHGAAAAAANATIDTINHLINPTPYNDFFSVGVTSDGSYGVQKGLIFSFPIRSDGKNWEIVKDIKLSDFEKEKIKISADELIKEKELSENL